MKEVQWTSQRPL